MAVDARRYRLVAALVAASWIPVPGAGATVTDDAGRTVQLPGPARRIITLSPHAAELAFDAGAGHRLVGTTAYSDYPPAAREVPRIGDAARLDRERILALRPDLAIVWPSGNRVRDLEWLAHQGIPLYFSEPSSLEDIAENLQEIGELAGSGQTARRAAETFLARLATLAERHRNERPLRVFYQVWHPPLTTIGTHHIINRVLALCGATSLFPELTTPAPRVSREAVIQADPDAIVVALPEGTGEDPFAPWRRWTELRAVREGRLVGVPAERIHRPTPAILDGAQAICRGLERPHPVPALPEGAHPTRPRPPARQAPRPAPESHAPFP